MSDWWAQKLAPVTQPRHGLTVPQQPQPVYYPQQPVYQQPQQVVQEPQEAPTAEIHAIDAVKRWKGGDAARMGGSCPECGSVSGYTNGYRSGRVNGAAPRSHCFECGWNGEFNQGDESRWGAVG
jgi:hypothetical protein